MPEVVISCEKCDTKYSWNTDNWMHQEYCPDCPTCGYNKMKVDDAKRDKCLSAAEKGDLDGVKQAFLDPDISKNLNAGPWTILHHAVAGNQIEVVKYLLSIGAKPDVAYNIANNETPLHIAALKGYIEIAKLLIDNGAKIDAKDSEGVTPIDRATDSDMIALLEPYESEMSVTNEYFVAVKNGDLSKVETFLKNGISADQKDPSKNKLGMVIGVPAICYAMDNEAQGKQLAEILIRHGADVNIRRNADISALHDAARHGRKDIAELLIGNGADINIRDVGKNTPLHFACDVTSTDKGRVGVMKLLIEKGADVNASNDRGETPLHLAISRCPNDDFTMLKILIDAGAKPDIESNNGNRPIDLTWQEKDKPKRDFLCKTTGLPGPKSLERSIKPNSNATSDKKPNVPSGNKSNEGCFIATACYGTPDCAEVLLLREFRDRHLVQSAIGRNMVKLYYYLSPSMAKSLSRHAGLRLLVKRVIVDTAVRLAPLLSRKNTDKPF